MSFIRSLVTCLLVVCYVICYAQTPLEPLKKNIITVSPTNIFFDGAANVVYYKRQISGKKSAKYLRFGTQFAGGNSKISEDSTSNFGANIYTVSLGLEFHKNLGDRFQLYFGPEVSYSHRSSISTESIPHINSVFVYQSVILGSSTKRTEGFKSTTNLINFIGFFGLKYFINEHFAIGMESGLGFGLYKVKTIATGKTDRIVNGLIHDIDPNRAFTFEYHF